MKSTRRAVLMGLATAAAPFVTTRSWARGPAPFRFALTPVFLDNDAAVISALRAALAEGMGQDIELVQRRTYQEISGALLDGSVDAAWTCGYPYLQHKTELSLLGVPVWRGLQLPTSIRRGLCEAGTFDEVGEAGEAPPYYRRPRWRIGSAVEIAPEPSNSPDVKCEVARCPALPLGRRLVEQLALVLRENRSGVGPWRLAAEHRQP